MMQYEFMITSILSGQNIDIILIKIFGTPELLNILNLYNIMAIPKIIYKTQGKTVHRHQW